MVERPARSLKTKNPSDPGKTENEGIQRILSKTIRQAGLILLFDGEVIDWLRIIGRGLRELRFCDSNSQHSTFNSQLLQPDEHSQTGILTSASNLIPPSRRRSCTHEAGQWLWEFVAVTVAQPSRISHRVPRHLTAISFKEQFVSTPETEICQEIFCKIFRRDEAVCVICAAASAPGRCGSTPHRRRELPASFADFTTGRSADNLTRRNRRVTRRQRMVQVDGLTKLYGELAAVSELTFSLQPGEVLGLVGPERRRQDHHLAVPRRHYPAQPRHRAR